MNYNHFEKKIDSNFIEKMNNHIASIGSYNNSLWLFEEDYPDFFKELRNELIKNNFLKKYVNENSYIVIRCIKQNDKKRSFESHFDNYEETILIPLMVPDELPRGELMMWPNARRYPKNIIEHLITKIKFQNKIFRFLLRKQIFTKFQKIDIQPGDVVKFPGFTTLHYNNPVSSERRSILIHNKKIFNGNYIVEIIEKLSKLNVK